MTLNKIKKAFDTIHAKEELKEKTRQYIYDNVYNKKNSFNKNKSNRLVLALATVLIMFITISTYITPVMAISIDSQSSIQFKVNKFNRVISVSAYDDNTNKLIQSLNLKHSNYEDALDLIINELESKNIIDEDTYVNISISTKDNNMGNKVLNEVENKYKEHYKNLNCNNTDASYQNEAKKHNMSIGKYQEFKNSQQNNPNLTIEEFKNSCIDSCEHKNQQKGKNK